MTNFYCILLLFIKFVKHFPVQQTLPSLFSFKPRDFSLPNSSWGSEMMGLYEHYYSQCEVETEGGEIQEGPWQRLPSYNRLLKYVTGNSAVCDVCVSFCLFVLSMKKSKHSYGTRVFGDNHVLRVNCIVFVSVVF